MATLKRFNSDEDAGMRMADDALQDLETRLNKVYAQAAAELTQSLDAYMAPFEALDEEMRGRYERGEITETEYITWRRNRILRTEQMHAQIESLTYDMVNADKIAVAMINDELPGVYCSGYNFAGFKGEMMAQAAGYNYASFSIYNTEAMRIILTEDPDLIPWQPPEVNIPADMRWNRKHIQNAIAQGILQGESIPKISNRLLPLVNMDRTAATRTARTSFTAVQNEGRRDATKKIQDAGIPMQEPWMALMADNTRDTHLMLHGTLPNEKGLYGEGIIPTGNLLRFPADPKGDPEQIYNCRCRVNSFLPGIDHSRDDELYEKMMREEFYDDWVGDKDAPGVMEYKVDEQRRALERKKKLDSGEMESDAARRYRRQQERQGGSIAPAVDDGSNRKPFTQRQFVPATTTKEAEEFASQFVSGGGFTLTNNTINYSGVDINVANQINERLAYLYDNFDLDKLSSIEAFGKKNKKLFEKHADAPFLTSNFNNLGMNTTILGKQSTIEKYIEDGQRNFQYVMDNMQSLKGAQLSLAQAYQTAGRSLVDESLNGMVTHEIGHHISYMGSNNAIFAEINKTTEWETYASHISGYANHSFGEYIAESFSAYVNGEYDKLQPEVLDIFDALRR